MKFRVVMPGLAVGNCVLRFPESNGYQGRGCLALNAHRVGSLVAANCETEIEKIGSFDMLQTIAYKAMRFNLSKLQGISDKTLEMHFKLYEGYVKSVNELNEKIAEMLKDGRVDQDEFPAYSELTRRLGFEYNGMVLHEYYFGNLQKHGAGMPASDSDFI